ncbi:serine/threonine-protein kinase [Candidatus Oscillochloris fontis]|uniref:serine/threonine-protein kinase n=1 Tax=Candidatus Oscillochloris fontis TaxID=2496868 RepID=UPI00101C0626|nr:serine/threonine-protein kinase [Candidatus Oscillochloris fontis]
MNSLLADNAVVSNRYQIIRQIGRGGMGAVYETLDLRLQTTVALKQRMTIDDTYRNAFEREARILARLRHPGLPIVSDHFFEGDDQFLVMEYVSGPNLQDLLEEQNGPLDEAESLRIADQILEILVYLHSHNPPIVHRDIKPQNIKISGTHRRPVLLDFGLAKGQSISGNTQTQASIFGYTRNYAPPEQIHNTGTDQRSDIYSLGATLYHMLTGKAPASAQDRMPAVLEKRADPLQPAISINPRINPAVSDLCTKALALAASDRFQTAAEMRAVLLATPSGRHFSSTTPLVKVADAETIAMGRASNQGSLQVAHPDHGVPQAASADHSSRRTVMLVGVAILLLVLLGGGSAAFALMQNMGDPTPVPLIASSAVSATPLLATNTSAPPTETALPPTETALPPSNTPIPPSNTPIPPSNTPIPPTDTPEPPTDTPEPPTDTPTLRPLPVRPSPIPIRPTIRPTIRPIVTPDINIEPTWIPPTIAP